MEWMGWFALIIVLCWTSFPGKTKQLEAKIKRLERKLKGDNYMSKLINELVGKTCRLQTNGDSTFDMDADVNCTILDADDEWIKFTYADKKGNHKTVILRIDFIENIELDNE